MEGNPIQNAPVKRKHSRKRFFKIACAILASILVISGIAYYESGTPYLIDKVKSPNGAYELLIYNCDISNKGLHLEKNKISVEFYSSSRKQTSYNLDGIYQGAFWTDDSTKFALNTSGGQSNITVINPSSGDYQSVDISLKHIFADAVNSNPEYGFTVRNTENVGIKNQDFKFLMWAPDGNSMLVQYKVTDTTGTQRKGYFRYAYDSCIISDLQLF